MNIGYIKLNDNAKLNSLAEKLNIELVNEEVWAEANNQFDNNNTQAEVRINGLDYIIVERSK